ncbi:MAG TPA: YciI family protein [Solirubrobacteraceae bacterium]|nr:YciI family protein [Solirubrobacteraceae bacterium]
MDKHFLLIYDYVGEMAERRGPYREAHLARIAAEQEAGAIVMAGALGDPPNGGAFVFRGVERDHVEAFVDADPYVQAGLVTGRRIERWTLV